ncbi:hypothetical protein HA402_008590 [Bradysia odoriphaga]|nr:hypothetical protein HA402_008590 [Bradysia odoriphaga]
MERTCTDFNHLPIFTFKLISITSCNEIYFIRRLYNLCASWRVTSLLSKTRRAPLSLLGSRTTTTTKKPLQRATNTLTSSLSKLLGLGAATTTTTPTPQTNIKEIVLPDLGSIQSKLNELRKSESLAAEKHATSTTENPQINASDPNVPTQSPPTSEPNTSKKVSLEPSQVDSVISPASCAEVELVPEPNILPQSVELLRDEKQNVESEQATEKDSFNQNGKEQLSVQDGQDSKAGKGDLNIDETMNKSEDAEAISLIPMVTDSTSESIESISNLKLTDSSKLESDSKNPVEEDPQQLSKNNELELSASEIIDQIDDGTPKKEEEEQSLPSISEELPSELINKSTDPTIHPTDLEFSASTIKAVEHPVQQKEDIHLISEDVLPLPDSPTPELPEVIIRSTDSLLPEVVTVIPSTISTDPVNLPLESAGPDNESPNPATLENTEINSSVIPVTDVETTQEKVTDAEHDNLPIQEDLSTNQSKSNELVRHCDSSNMIECETENGSELNTLPKANNLLPSTKTDTQSTDSEDLPVDLANPVVETENIDNLAAIPSETPVVFPLPEVTVPPTSAVNYVFSTESSKLSSPNFNTGNIGLQSQTYSVPVGGSPFATSLGTYNSVREFYNLFNYGVEPLVDIHNKEFNLLKIVIF